MRIPIVSVSVNGGIAVPCESGQSTVERPTFRDRFAQGVALLAPVATRARSPHARGDARWQEMLGGVPKCGPRSGGMNRSRSARIPVQ
jgi:hypothetical protein